MNLDVKDSPVTCSHPSQLDLTPYLQNGATAQHRRIYLCRRYEVTSYAKTLEAKLNMFLIRLRSKPSSSWFLL